MSHTLIITGMHRSGTSLVASLIQKAGVNIGTDLLGPNKGNPRGHFEDVDFYDFHEKILRRLSQNYLVQSRFHEGTFTSEEVDEAKALIQQREIYSIWGWKDPRTSLFLNSWNEIVPGASYIFVYRAPTDVVLSLLRRGTDLDIAANPLAGLRSWHVYNQAILDFHAKHPECCALTNIAGITGNLTTFLDVVIKKLALPLQINESTELYHADELNQTALSTTALSLLSRIAPKAVELYRQLEAHADLPGEMFFDQPSNIQNAGFATLQRIADDLTQSDYPDEAQVTSAFTLLLATVDPQAVLSGKEALAQYRLVQLNDLEQNIRAQAAQIHGLTTYVNNLESRLSNDEARFQSLAGQISVLEQTISTRNAYLQNLEAHIESLRQIVVIKDTNLQSLDMQAVSLRQSLVEKEAANRGLSDQNQKLQQIVDFMANSKAWRLRNKWHAFRQTVRSAVRIPQTLVTPLQSSDYGQEMSTIKPTKRSANSAPKVLFISHDAHQHGAQILLLNLLKWLKAHSDLQFEILLKNGGELFSDFEGLASALLWSNNSVTGSVPDAATVKQIKRHLKQANIRLIYSNTITNGNLLTALADLACPIICHVHELKYWITYRTEPDNNKQVRKLTTHYIAASQAVKRDLMKTLNIPENQIDVVYEYIPLPAIQECDSQARHRTRKQLQIPDDALVVGASGTTDWRKGPDIFIQLAQAVCARLPAKPVHFVWVGGDKEGPIFGALWHDVEQCGLGECVHFTGAQDNPLEYFSTFDVFALVSREDPFPVVNLEAASLAKPVVCFEGSGGAVEFVENDCGFVVPYLNVEAMADRVMELLNSPELRARLGQQAAQKVREQHDVNIVAPKILEIIQRFA